MYLASLLSAGFQWQGGVLGPYAWQESMEKKGVIRKKFSQGLLE